MKVLQSDGYYALTNLIIFLAALGVTSKLYIVSDGECNYDVRYVE